MKPPRKKLGSDGVALPRLYHGYGLRPNYHAIYFVLARDKFLRSAVAYLKIGMSIDPIARVVGLQSSSPLPFERAWYIQVPESSTKRIERDLHDRLSSRRCRGEWFRVVMRSKKDREAIKRRLVSYFIDRWIIPVALYPIDVPRAVAAMAALGYSKNRTYADVPLGVAIRNGWHKQ